MSISIENLARRVSPYPTTMWRYSTCSFIPLLWFTFAPSTCPSYQPPHLLCKSNFLYPLNPYSPFALRLSSSDTLRNIHVILSQSHPIDRCPRVVSGNKKYDARRCGFLFFSVDQTGAGAFLQPFTFQFSLNTLNIRKFWLGSSISMSSSRPKSWKSITLSLPHCWRPCHHTCCRIIVKMHQKSSLTESNSSFTSAGTVGVHVSVIYCLG